MICLKYKFSTNSEGPYRILLIAGNQQLYVKQLLSTIFRRMITTAIMKPFPMISFTAPLSCWVI